MSQQQTYLLRIMNKGIEEEADKITVDALREVADEAINRGYVASNSGVLTICPEAGEFILSIESGKNNASWV